MPTASAILPHLGRSVRFGRIRATEEQTRKILPLAPFVKRYGGKPPPDRVTYHTNAAKSLAEMLGNDQYGDCVLAAALHGVGIWSANEPGGKERIATTTEAVRQYQRICGPGDNGCYIPAVLNHFRDAGLQAGGLLSKIDGYVSVNPRDALLCKIATFLFGGLHLGVNWPRDWMDAARPGGVLRPTNSDIVGGHAIRVGGYDPNGLIVSTWGIVCTLSWEALADRRFVDECYCELGTDWYNERGETAAGHGVDVKLLREALAVIASGGVPVIPNDPTPPEPDPEPDPLEPGEIELAGWLDFFQQKLPIKLSGHYLRETASARGTNWFAVISAALAIFSAIQKKDWVALMAAIEALIAALGTQLSDGDKLAFAESLKAYAETSPLACAKPTS